MSRTFSRAQSSSFFQGESAENSEGESDQVEGETSDGDFSELEEEGEEFGPGASKEEHDDWARLKVLGTMMLLGLDHADSNATWARHEFHCQAQEVI